MENPHQKFIVPILIGVVVLVLAAGGYLYTKNKSSENSSVQSTQSENKNQNIAPVSGTDDWLTYTNTEYGFEFKYPKDLFLTGGNYFYFGKGVAGSDQRGFRITVSECVGVWSNCTQSINNKNANRLDIMVVPKSTAIENYTTDQNAIFAENDKYFFKFTGYGTPNEFIKRTHATFRSIPITDRAISQEWVTYKNETYGFEFKYPEYFGTFRSNIYMWASNDSTRNVFPYTEVAENFPLPSKRTFIGFGVKLVGTEYHNSLRNQFRSGVNVAAGEKVFDNGYTQTYFDYVDKLQFYTFGENGQKKYLEKKYVNGNLYVCDSSGEGSDEGWGVEVGCVIYNQKHDYLLKIGIPLSTNYSYIQPELEPAGESSPALEKILSSLKFTK